MSEFINYLNAQVDKAIYVWGGQGKDLTQMTFEEACDWIRHSEGSIYNADRDIALLRKRLGAGVSPVLAFDCSGLLMYFLQNIKGVFRYDMTARAIYNKCSYHPTRQELERGDLVFKGKDEKSITHIGVYIGNGKVIEARGRDYGVVKDGIEENAWSLYGHLAELDPFITEPKHPNFCSVASPMERGEEYKAMQVALNLAGFTDYSDDPLDEDGKWGKKSASAFDKMITFYGGEK